MSPPRISLDDLPIPALATKDGVFVAVNRPFEELTGRSAETLVGRRFEALLGDLVVAEDRPLLAHVAAEGAARGEIWCQVLDARGAARPFRVEWRVLQDGVHAITVLLDATPEAFGQEVTAALARVAGSLSRCASEEEVLVRATEALAERGFTATVLLWDEEDPLLRYGPSRSSGPSQLRVEELPRLPRELLSRINPGFLERRAAFFQDGIRLAPDAYPEPVAERVKVLLPAGRMVQAPLFLDEAPYGALFVTGAALTPLVATALDLFAELVGKALESVRLRRERAMRERLAALGEAAAVMAHEVRNPVAAMMNALVLLRRTTDAAGQQPLLAILGEETERLAELVSQLLELGRPIHPRPASIALEDLAARAVRLLETRGQLAGRTIGKPETKGTLAWLDPTLAELALFNVLVNGVQSTRERGGDVRIFVDAVEDLARVVVEDDGPGIPENLRARVGQPFVTTRATGTGMGLAVVRKIMDASAGRLVLEPRPEGGTRVVLEFPRRGG